ncbi:MAG TPA: DUF21 domain-containing protein, partial [Microbacterium sp.]|nr:DUF21 domain-containing protein [Microbacterium sp.]
MTPFFLLAAAVLLVAFGGLMAAVDAAFSVTSSNDIEELASEGRGSAALHSIAADPDPHVNAVAFMRVLSETTAAVLVTVALDSLLPSIWWAMLAAAVLMTGITFVLVGASPRSYGRLHADTILRAWAPTVRG